MNQSKPVNNYENGVYLCHCLKTGQLETIWRKSSERNLLAYHFHT